MNIDILPLSLDGLDQVDTDLLILAIFEDVRPLRGLEGYADWRAKGRLSRLVQQSFASGSRGEKVLSNRLGSINCKRILLIGLGKSDEFDNLQFANTVEKSIEVIQKLSPESCSMSIPGTDFDDDYFLERLAILAKNLYERLTVDVTIFVDEAANIKELRAKFELIKEEVERHITRVSKKKKKSPPPVPDKPVFGKLKKENE